jgi:hypothetical protein
MSKMSDLDSKCRFHRLYKLKWSLEREYHIAVPSEKQSYKKHIKAINDKLMDAAKNKDPYCYEAQKCMFCEWREAMTKIE